VKRNDDVEENKSKFINILSVAQFRPEKDHQLQIKAMKELKQVLEPEVWNKGELGAVSKCKK